MGRDWQRQRIKGWLLSFSIVPSRATQDEQAYLSFLRPNSACQVITEDKWLPYGVVNLESLSLYVAMNIRPFGEGSFHCCLEMPMVSLLLTVEVFDKLRYVLFNFLVMYGR